MNYVVVSAPSTGNMSGNTLKHLYGMKHTTEYHNDNCVYI